MKPSVGGSLAQLKSIGQRVRAAAEGHTVPQAIHAAVKELTASNLEAALMEMKLSHDALIEHALTAHSAGKEKMEAARQEPEVKIEVASKVNLDFCITPTQCFGQ